MKKSNAMVLAMTALVLVVYAAPTLAQKEATLPYMPPDQTDGPWENTRKVAPVYPRRALTRREEGCAVVGYIIESDGRTSAHRGITSYPSERFVDPSIKAAKEFTYAPRASNPERVPVYTTNVFTYQLGRGEETNERVREALGDICRSATKQLLGAGDEDPATQDALSEEGVEAEANGG